MTELKSSDQHVIDQILSPVSVILQCSCGWRQQFSRRQNALARAKKVRAAIDRHKVTELKRGTTTELSTVPQVFK